MELIVRFGLCLTDHATKGGRIVRNTMLLIAVALAVGFWSPSEAAADGIPAKRHLKRVVAHPVTCVHAHCVVRRPVCPDGYACYSLYGAYGPYGGSLYWTRFTYAGWGYR